jgi:hypothetical protein
MTVEELFEVWAPRGRTRGGPDWSRWAKPVIFTAFRRADLEPAFRSVGLEPGASLPGSESDPDAPTAEVPLPDVSWAPPAAERSAVVVDVQGADSAWYGLALAQRGYRPVPLYNASPSPYPETASARVDLRLIMDVLLSQARRLRDMPIPDDAPPVFMIDSLRLAEGRMPDGWYELPHYDNRWVVLPQDFPSANLLLSSGIRQVLLVQDREGAPKNDLAHVLLRWQQAGIAITAKNVRTPDPANPIVVSKPSRFKRLWYVAMVLVGLERNSTGGFGGVLPEAGSGGGG